MSFFAQEVSCKWVQGIGGAQDDEGISIARDNAGNLFYTGTFQDTMDFDPGIGTYTLAPFGYQDIFISKYDSTGKFIWAKQIGGNTGDDDPYSIAADISGNVIITGAFIGTADFDPGIATYSLTSHVSFVDNFLYYDVFILKLDPAGNFMWAKEFGGSSHDYPHSMALDAFGNIYTAGEFQDTVDFDPGIGISTHTAQTIDVFVSKLDPNGNFLWAKQLSGPNVEAATAITIDLNNNIVFGGMFQDTVDFNPGTGTYTIAAIASYDMFICKLDALGNFIWAKSIDYAGVKSLVTDALGNIHATGFFNGIGDFDPGAGSYTMTSNSDDAFVLKLNSGGNFIWAKQTGGSWAEIGKGIALDASGNVYTTGDFEDVSDFNFASAGTNTFTSFGSDDIFIWKLDPAGNFLWAKQMGGPQMDYGNFIMVDPIGNIFTTGKYRGMADFDPNVGVFNIASHGFSDVFIQRIGNGSFVGIPENELQSKIKLYPNPVQNKLFIDFPSTTSEYFSIKIENSLGQVVFSKNDFNQKQEIDLNLLVSGVYFCTMKGNIKSETFKIIKE